MASPRHFDKSDKHTDKPTKSYGTPVIKGRIIPASKVLTTQSIDSVTRYNIHACYASLIL